MKQSKQQIVTTGIVCLIVGVAIGYMYGVRTITHKNMNMNMTGDAMNHEMSGMVSGLQGKSGDDFDKAFLSEMVVHHQGAVDMSKTVLQTSKRPEMLELARDIIKAQTQEINMMKNWKRIWFGGN